MKIKITLLFLILMNTSCKHQKLDLPTDIKREIENLSTDEEKSLYLNKLWHEDQNLRDGEEGTIISKYGHSSDEHKAWVKEFKTKDNVIFQKLEFYLSHHGYPQNPSSFDELALNAFPIIIGHNHNYDSQLRLLPYLHEAYKDGNCALGDVVWVLGEMHESKYNGRRHEMTSSIYKTEDEFDELTKKLNLDLKR